MPGFRHFFITLAIVLSTSTLIANDLKETQFNPIYTGVNSLLIAPDARGASLGDIGAATEPDANSQYWNASKYAFALTRGDIAVNYTPWLRSLINDIYLVDVSGFYKPGTRDNQAIGASIRYFSLGNLTMESISGSPAVSYHPSELSVDVSYSHKLSQKYSMAIVLRYIYSDLGFADYNGNLSPGTSAFSGDVSGYFTYYPIIGRNECQWSWGWNLSNIGTKVNYNQGADPAFLPTNLRIGTTFVFPLADGHNLGVSGDLNKLLVPNKPRESEYDTSTPEGQLKFAQALEDWENTSGIAGIFKSFSDAPGGFKEELREISYSLGAEYDYNNRFFLRAGYHHQSRSKGDNSYLGFGAGFSFNNIIKLDASYMVATSRLSPLDQTLRLSLTFGIDSLAKLFGQR